MIASVCRRHCLFEEDAEEFAAWVQVRLIDNDYAVLRKYQGRSSLSTYLSTVVLNLLRDYRIQLWGKWRPSARAKRLGPTAVQLETLLYRDGYTFTEAAEILRLRVKPPPTREDLEKIAGMLPSRTRRGPAAGDETLETLGVEATVNGGLRDDEKARTLRRVQDALADAFSAFAPEDQLIMKLRFGSGFKVVQIAEFMGLAQKPLYARIQGNLGRLRAALEQSGVDAEAVADMYGWHGLDMDLPILDEENEELSV